MPCPELPYGPEIPSLTSDVTSLKLFGAYSGYIPHETFSFMMSLPAISLGLRFYVSRKGGTGGGGWVHLKGANSMAASGLVFRSDLVGINGVRNQQSHLLGSPFPEFKARFSSYGRLAFLERLN